MIKLFISCIDSREDGTAVTIFEDFQLNYKDKESILEREDINDKIFNKIYEVEKINEEITRPF